jgi:hypothetical protein
MLHEPRYPSELGLKSLIYGTALGAGAFGLGSRRVMEYGLGLTLVTFDIGIERLEPSVQSGGPL